MSEKEYYSVLFKENIFSPFSYDIGNIPTNVTFGEFVFDFKKPDEPFADSYVIVSYFNGDIPNELIKNIQDKYLTTECGICSKIECISKSSINIPSEKLYITKTIGLQVFILEMKRYMNRVYNKNSKERKLK